MVYGPGTPGAPDHDRYLLALGRATWEASALCGIAFDLLRVLGDVDSSDLYDDPLGALENKLRGVAKRRVDVTELGGFLEELANARALRNDLIHALPVHDGLHRRRERDPSYVRDFFTVESLDECADSFARVRANGLTILYRDDGAEVDRWYGR